MYRLRSNAYSRRLRTQKHVLRLAARKKEMKKKGADSASIKKAVEEEEKAASMEAEKDIVEVIHRVEKAGEESSEAGASVSTIEMQLKAILEGQVALAQSGAAERARMDAELAKMEEERVKERERLEEEIEKLRAEAAARAENEIALGSPGKVDPEEIKRESMRKVEDEISEKRDKLEKQHIQEEMDALEKNITAKEEAAESAADIAAREAKEREEAKLKEKLENIKSQNEWFEKMGKAELNVKKEAQKKKLEERRAKLKLKKEREQLIRARFEFQNQGIVRTMPKTNIITHKSQFFQRRQKSRIIRQTEPFQHFRFQMHELPKTIEIFHKRLRLKDKIFDLLHLCGIIKRNIK